MRSVTPALATLISGGEYDTFDLYEFDLRGGGSLYLTTSPFNVIQGGVSYPRNGPILVDASGAQRAHWRVGTDVDQWTITIAPRLIDPLTGDAYPDKIGNKPMLSAIRGGVLSGSEATVQRAFFDPIIVNPATIWPVSGFVPVGTIILFKGLVADISLGTDAAVITINDYRSLLSSQMPRNIYQAPCRHMLFDSGCKLNAEAFRRTGVVTDIWSTREFFSNVPVPAGSLTYSLGRVRADSGDNIGLIRTIRAWDGASHFVTVSPFPYPLQLGDALSFWPGCLKSLDNCALFNNLDNYGGDPYIPPPAASA